MNTENILNDLEILLNAGQKDDAMTILKEFQKNVLFDYKKLYLENFKKKFQYPIRFFYFDKIVGEFECPLVSDEITRRKIATDNNIDKWTHFILGDNTAMGIKLKESKHDLRGEQGEYSTADYLPLPTGDYLVWTYRDCTTSTIKLNL